MGGSNEVNGISWQQFVVIILPLFVALLVVTYTLNLTTKAEIREEIVDNRQAIRHLQDDIADLKLQIARFESKLGEKEGRRTDK